MPGCAAPISATDCRTSYIRYRTSLPLRLNELAILITAREWTSQYEWYAHYPLAMKAGLDAKVADNWGEGL
jgi:4-carboxymuconolactone decarboxylase